MGDVISLSSRRLRGSELYYARERKHAQLRREVERAEIMWWFETWGPIFLAEQEAEFQATAGLL